MVRVLLLGAAALGVAVLIDRQFGTTDVLIILPVAALTARYVQHFSQQDREAA